MYFHSLLNYFYFHVQKLVTTMYQDDCSCLLLILLWVPPPLFLRMPIYTQKLNYSVLSFLFVYGFISELSVLFQWLTCFSCFVLTVLFDFTVTSVKAIHTKGFHMVGKAWWVSGVLCIVSLKGTQKKWLFRDRFVFFRERELWSCWTSGI